MLRFLLIFFFSLNFLSAQVTVKKALPKITHFDMKEMGYGPQSWAITQDETGIIYVANMNNLLTYDGNKWDEVPTNPEMVNRSIYIKNKDSIYFGSDGYHGLLVKKGFSQYEPIYFKDTNESAASDVQEYWRTHRVGEDIIFQTFRNIYVNQDNIITKIPAPYLFKWSYNVEGQIYVNDLKYGVFKLEDTNLIPVISDPNLNENIVGVTKIDNDLVIITDTEGIFKLVNGELVAYDFNIINEIQKAQIFSHLKLNDNRLAIGTVSNGLYLLDLKSGKAENINKRNGLQNNTILSLYEDNEFNLWLALDYGIDLIELNSPLTYYRDYFGELGTAYAYVSQEENAYLGTNQGLYRIDETNTDDPHQLLLNGQVWNIDKIDDQIFVGHDKGAFVIEKGKLNRLGKDLGAWNFNKINLPSAELSIISGNYNGISLYQFSNNLWESYPLEGMEKSSRFIEIDTEGYIWTALRSEGVFRFKLDYQKKQLIKDAFYPLEKFGGNVLSLSKVDGNIVITSGFKEFLYNSSQRDFEEKKINELKGEAPRIKIIGNETWYSNNDKVTVQIEDNVISFDEIKDQLIQDVTNVFEINKTTRLIPIFNGYSIFTNTDLDYPLSKKNDLIIREFTSVNSDQRYADSSIIPFSDNDLMIRYALPIFSREIRYQTKLNDGEWSNWTKKTTQTLYNLKEGDYSYKIKASYHGIEKETQLNFKIEPPIYRSIWAYLVYFLFAVLMILLTVSVNRYKMKKQERILLQQKAEKLKKQEEEHRAQKLEQERKIIELNNSKLQDEIKAKSRELTQIAYVNLNKNKILKKIRDKIVKVQENSNQKLSTHSYNELVRLVEYYITDKESKLFEINFDKSHQDFYERLSKNYPNLTSKDLRLCAYLKMNLSSKEIAPLLGISSQSVDVSRHRLRKKLNLDSKDNLTNILLSFT